jgi:hypothetical protein
MAAFLDSKKEIAQELIAEAMACMKEKIRKATLKDTVSMVEKLSVVFKDKDGVELQDDEGKVTIIFKDCGGGNSE